MIQMEAVKCSSLKLRVVGERENSNHTTEADIIECYVYATCDLRGQIVGSGYFNTGDDDRLQRP